MKKHTKIYMQHFGYVLDDFIPCEVCGTRAVDIHHIHRRGIGGNKAADQIQNLMAVCRKCHVEYGDKKEHLEWLQQIQHQKMSQG